MSVRPGYPAGVPCWVDVEQPDPGAAADFYAGLFGWELEDRGTDGTYLVGRLGGRDVAAIASPHGSVAGTPAWHTYVAVADVPAAVERAVVAGGRVADEGYDLPGGVRAATIIDPDGAELRLWHADVATGAEAVNEPGTWNFSNLVVADPSASQAFYAAVFGWRAVEVDLGGGPSWMLQLPGYGDFLAEHDPELRERHADPSVPAGFSDAIGWIMPRPEARPGWEVTFAVDDAYAVAERAVELGGKEVVAAADMGLAQVAVLADPQGAVFTVSRYTPP